MKKIIPLILCFYVFSFQYSLFSKNESLIESEQNKLSEDAILGFLLQRSSLEVTDKNKNFLKEVLLNRLKNSSVNDSAFYAHKHEFKSLVDDALSSIKQVKKDSRKSNESFLDKIPIKFLFYLGSIVFVDYKFNFLKNFKFKKIKEILGIIFNNKKDETREKYIPFNKTDASSFLLNIKKYSNGVEGVKDFNIMLQRLCVENNICDLSLKKLETKINGNNFELEDRYQSLIEINKLFETDYGKSETRKLSFF